MATQTGSIDLKAMKASSDIAVAAAKTATNFLSTDSSGIMIYDGKNGAQTPSNPSADTKNVFIDSDSVDVRKGTTVLATFGANGSRIGKSGAGYVETKPGGIAFGDADGEHMNMGIVTKTIEGNSVTTYEMNSIDPVYISHSKEHETNSYYTLSRVRLESNIPSHASSYVSADSNILSGLETGDARLYARCGTDNDWYSAQIQAYATTSDSVAFIGAEHIDLLANSINIKYTKPITKQTYSATSLSASAYYLSRTFNIAKTGYTPIAVNARTNQAAVYVASIDFSNPASTSVTVGHRTASSISGLNLYLDVTYVRNELI